MGTPETKETANEERWMDGDAIRSAIGQSVNSYAAIHMAKYIATLAIPSYSMTNRLFINDI